MKTLKVRLQTILGIGKNLVPSLFWLIKTNKCGIRFIAAILFSLSFLTGCNTNPNSGYPSYEIEYASGNAITSITNLSKPVPIEGSELLIYTEQIKGSGYQMYIENREGEIVYTSENAESRNRGQLVDGDLFICGENWHCVYRQQFVDKTLETGRIYQVDLDSREILSEQVLEKNEFLITIHNNKAYFYYRGLESEKKLFALMTAPSENAEIYYRDIADWDLKQTVHTFDYAGVPPEAEEGGNFTLYFKVLANEIIMNLHSYEKMNGEDWGNAVIWSVEVPFE